MAEEREMDATKRVRELRTIAADVANPRPAILAAVGQLDLRPGMRLLDVGCGPGVHLPLFAERVSPGGAVVGLDLEDDRLAIAAEICGDLINAGIVRLEVGDAGALPFETGSFDVAWASSVLHHHEQPQAMLAEMMRVVRPGGLVAIVDGDNGLSFPSLPWPPDLEERVRAANWRAAAENYGGTLPYHFDGYVGRKLPRLLREAGLIDQRLYAFSDVDRAPLNARREEELREWFLGSFSERIAGYLAATDLDRYRALFDPASDAYLLADPDFFFVRTSLLAIGRKPG